jgi:hypothetical protein
MNIAPLSVYFDEEDKDIVNIDENAQIVRN